MPLVPALPYAGRYMPVLNDAQSEASIERSCVNFTKAHGCTLLKLQGARGWPDRLLLIPNRPPIFIEFKKVGGELSPIQRHTMEQIRAMGFQAEEVDSRVLFKHLFGHLMVTKPEESTGWLDHRSLPSSSHQDLVKQVQVWLPTLPLAALSSDEFACLYSLLSKCAKQRGLTSPRSGSSSDT